MLSQRLLSESDYNESISADDFTAATELTSIRIDSEAVNNTGPTPPTVAPIYLTHTTAKLEQLLKDISVAEDMLEKNIKEKRCSGANSVSITVLAAAMAFSGVGIYAICKGVDQSEDGNINVGSVILALGLTVIACLKCHERNPRIAREENRRDGIYHSDDETLSGALTEDEVAHIQRTAMIAGLDAFYVQDLQDGISMRAASKEFISRREKILKTIHRNRAVESVLNELATPAVLSELVLDYCDRPGNIRLDFL